MGRHARGTASRDAAERKSLRRARASYTPFARESMALDRLGVLRGERGIRCPSRAEWTARDGDAVRAFICWFSVLVADRHDAMSSFEAIPIPIRDHLVSTGATTQITIDLTDPRATEPLVDLKSHNLAGDNYYFRSDGNNAPYNQRIPGAISHLYARAGVTRRLLVANRMLSRYGVELYILDAFRPIACQRALWSFFWEKMKTTHPDLRESQLGEIVRKYVSDPRAIDYHDITTWPAHSTGGAVDVVLRHKVTHELLDFGASFDDPSDRSHTDFLERGFASGTVSQPDSPLVNRRLLYNAMISAGFANYPYEYWHYDYGDQLFIINAPAAGHRSPDAAFYPPIEAVSPNLLVELGRLQP